MTATIFNIQRCCVHDGPGIRTTVFFKGCNMRCKWCHNPESFLPTPQLDFGKEYTVANILDIVRRDSLFYQQSGGGITCSGGEPTQQFDFLFELLKACKSEGIHTCIETNAAIQKAKLQPLALVTDLFLVDFKHSNDEAHKFFTGMSNEIVLETLECLSQMQKEVVLRCPIIPTINDTFEHFEYIRTMPKRFSAIKKIELMPYHDIGVSKWEKLSMKYTLPNIKIPTLEEKKKWEAAINLS